ncbi:MAG: VOC family protein [Saccharofermentanales bacterium]|jgi:catechol 2,3-dioxygenase-like lactoylglutathione lyase family enzyme
MKIFKNIFHISLFCNDLQKSLDYYKKLGFEEMFGIYEADNPEPWDVYMKIAHEQYLELQPVHSNNPHPHPEVATYYENQTVWHFSLQTENMEFTIRELTKNGIDIWLNPEKTSRVNSIDEVYHSDDGCLVVWLIDPDGTPIEVMEQVGLTKQRQYDP